MIVLCAQQRYLVMCVVAQQVLIVLLKDGLVLSCVTAHSFCGEQKIRSFPNVDIFNYCLIVLFSFSEQKCLSLWRDEDVQTERETRDQSVRHQ